MATDQNPFLPSTTHLDAAVENAAIGVGTSRDKMAKTFVGAGTYLHWREKQRLYDGDWLIARICEAVPQKVAEAGWSLKLGEKDDEDLKKKVQDYIENIFVSPGLSLPPNMSPVQVKRSYKPEEILDQPQCNSIISLFTRAQIMANVEDGCAIVINVDDGQDPSQPILKNKIRKVISLDILRRKEIRPAWEYTRDAYDPIYYNLLLEKRPFAGDTPGLNLNSGKSVFIHRSRVIPFHGVKYVSEDRLRWNEGWRGSVIDKIWEDFKQWRVALTSTSNTLSDGSLFVYMLRGLRELVLQGKEAYLQKRVQLMVQNMSQMGGIAVDANDEQVNFLSRQYGGMYQLLEQFLNVIVAATGIPHTLILGDSPSGLGATGESERRAIEDLKREFFENEYEGKLRYLYRILFLAKDSPTRGKEPEEWSIEYQGGFNPTIDEKLAYTNSLINALSGAIASQFLTPEEARLSFEGTVPKWGLVLDDKLWKKSKEEQQQQMGMGGFPGGGMEEAPPEEEMPPEENPPEEEVPPGEDDFSFPPTKQRE